MLNAWRKFRPLSAHQRRLLLEAAAQLLCAWLGLRIFSFLTLRRLLGGSSLRRGGRPHGSIEQMREVIWAVSAAARHLFPSATCLIEALAADAMLRRRGCVCDLRFGVMPQGNHPTFLAAHAWLEHDGIVMLGQLDNLSEYSVLTVPKGL